MADPIKDIVVEAAYHIAEIVPLQDGKTSDPVTPALDKLPPQEARKMRRKFRKLWRKFAKHPSKNIPQCYTDQLGLGVQEPTYRHAKARKREVHRRFRHEICEEILRSAVQTPEEE